ncbi:MAG: DNA-3-methyladenine glycosylase 2 family protein [bacterium]
MTGRDKALMHFRRADPKLHAAARAVRKELPPELGQVRTRQGLFERLSRSVVGQQLATGAARAIWQRVVAACGGSVTPAAILAASLPSLRAAGLSGAKAKTLKSLAEAVETKSLDLLALKRLPEAEAIASLSSVWGIGAWTAEMFLIFALGRSDVFSVGDLGLVRSMERIYKLKKGVPREKLLKIAESWSPHRSYACLALWKSHDLRNK